MDEYISRLRNGLSSTVVAAIRGGFFPTWNVPLRMGTASRLLAVLDYRLDASPFMSTLLIFGLFTATLMYLLPLYQISVHDSVLRRYVLVRPLRPKSGPSS